LRDAVNSVYEDFLKNVTKLEEIAMFRTIISKVSAALEGLSNKVVLGEIQRRQSGQGNQHKSIKQVEIETLLSSPIEVGEDVAEGDFYAKARDLSSLKPTIAPRIERIVLVHRLREVIAQVGFT
jgi:hypothetical protein